MTDDPTKSGAAKLGQQKPYQINLIGGLRVFSAGQPVEFTKNKSRALLALLAISSGQSMNREAIRGILWPNSKTEESAQNSLRAEVYTIRHPQGQPAFQAISKGGAEIKLYADQVDVDIDRLLDALDRGDYEAAFQYEPQAVAQLDRGYGSVTKQFEHRMQESSAHFARLVRQRLRRCATSLNDARERTSIYRFIADMDPADEGAAVDLIRAYAECGQRSNALAAYQALWNYMENVLDDFPSEETQDIVAQIKLDDPGTKSPSKDQRHRIFVTQGDYDHLDADGRQVAVQLREDLCANLARFSEWQVFDADRVGGGISDDSSAERTYFLTLRVSQRGAEPTCRAVLSDHQSGELIWSSKNQGRPNDLLFPESNTPDQIAAALNIHLVSRATRDRHDSVPEVSAYERWVKAQGLILEFTTQSWIEAEKQLDQLIKEFPDFSRAFSSRASIENMRQISFPGQYSTPELHLKALQLARRAIELDPLDTRGQLAMGWSSAMSRQFSRSETAFELAFQYNENDPWTIVSSAVGLAFCDNHDAAGHLLNVLFGLNFDLEPSHWSYIAATKFLAGDFAACVTASEKSNAISHDVPAWHAAALALIGRKEEAARVASQFEAIARRNWAVAGPKDTSEITRWLISGFPIRNRDTWLAFRDGLRLAGMPVPDLIQSDRIAVGYKLIEDD